VTSPTPTSAGFLLEQGPYGLRAVLTSHWTANVERQLLKTPISELEFNYAKGWLGQELPSLGAFPDLLAFTIIGMSIKSVSPIHSLHELRSLKVLTHCKTEIHFDQFPRLLECGIEWRTGAKSLFECISLKKLFINRYSGQDTSAFAKLRTLESLTLLGSPIKSLGGLKNLADLRFLRLGALRSLATLKGIEELTCLERLEINTCRRISSIEEIGTQMNLQELYLDNVGDVRSLKPLSRLLRLRRLTFVESTNILDGELSVLFGLPMLELVSFQNRKHYSHRREEFGAIRQV
jgi:Leucine-rich repeat (LRR) protein